MNIPPSGDKKKKESVENDALGITSSQSGPNTIKCGLSQPRDLGFTGDKEEFSSAQEIALEGLQRSSKCKAWAVGELDWGLENAAREFTPNLLVLQPHKA